ncbi:MAG: Aldose 1-epimerase [Actinomycetia bacterium]|nr:Aldose 1-epimerase [Actinomycetes bacterium]
MRLTAGPLTAVFTPALGMTGVSLCYRGGEYLALPGGLDRLRAGHSGGLPLLAPWANRLSAWRYRAAGRTVDLAGLPLHVDDNGLPIHGLLLGRSSWSVEDVRVVRGTARLRASTVVDAPAFPFAHRIEVAVTAGETALRIDTSVVPTARRAVPISFGWHPYLRLPGDEPRSRWRLRLPARRRLITDGLGIPNGAVEREPAENRSIGRRTLDAGYALSRSRRLAIESDGGRSVEVACGSGYSFAQVWVPPRRPFVALEPMTAPTNALVTGEHLSVTEPFTASFALVFDGSPSAPEVPVDNGD